MSSFICTPKHFNTIENEFSKYYFKTDPQTTLHPFDKFGLNSWSHSKGTDEKKIKEIFTDLRELNVLSYLCQYIHHENYEIGSDEFKAEILQQTKYLNTETEVKELTLLGFYRGLGCLQYQIEPENIDTDIETRLDIKTLLEFLHVALERIAHTICGNLPDDNTNNWLID